MQNDCYYRRPCNLLFKRYHTYLNIAINNRGGVITNDIYKSEAIHFYFSLIQQPLRVSEYPLIEHVNQGPRRERGQCQHNSHGFKLLRFLLFASSRILTLLLIFFPELIHYLIVSVDLTRGIRPSRAQLLISLLV